MGSSRGSRVRVPNFVPTPINPIPTTLGHFVLSPGSLATTENSNSTAHTNSLSVGDKLPVVERFSWQLQCTLVAVAIVERWLL